MNNLKLKLKITLKNSTKYMKYLGQTCENMWETSTVKSMKCYLLLFSCPVASDSLWSHGLQHDRPPCPSPSPGVCLSSRSLHQWCHPAISFSDDLFSFYLQSFPASGTFPMSYLFASDNWCKISTQQDKLSFSFSISLSSEYLGSISLKIDWFDLLAVQETFRSLLWYHSSKVSILWCSAIFEV